MLSLSKHEDCSLSRLAATPYLTSDPAAPPIDSACVP